MVRRFFFIICMLEGAGRAVNRTQTQPTRSRCSNSNAIAIEICSVIFAVIEKQTNILFGCRLYSVVVNSVEICSSQRRCSNREGNKYIFMCVSFVGHPADVAPTVASRMDRLAHFKMFATDKQHQWYCCRVQLPKQTQSQNEQTNQCNGNWCVIYAICLKCNNWHNFTWIQIMRTAVTRQRCHVLCELFCVFRRNKKKIA